MRNLTITSNGASLSILVPNNNENYWIFVVSAGLSGGATAALQASTNNRDWFDATDVSGAVNFSSNKAVLVSAGLYYRLVVSDYSSEIKVTIKPN